MTTVSVPIPRFRALDLVLVLWTVLCIALGVWVGVEVRNLTQLSNTVTTGGRALNQTSVALHELEGIPFIGSRLKSMRVKVHAAAVEAKASGASSHSTIDDLSVLLAVAIALVPTVPVIAVYLLYRPRTA
jgi:hypothetical protein